jgi:Flp pilus assembly pilin Flp
MNFKRLLRSNRGQTGIAIALIITLVTISIIIPVGLWLSSTLLTLMTPTNASMFTTTYNATYSNLSANIFAAYSLSTILPIIAVAGVIIAAITGFIVWRRSGQ